MASVSYECKRQYKTEYMNIGPKTDNIKKVSNK